MFNSKNVVPTGGRTATQRGGIPTASYRKLPQVTLTWRPDVPKGTAFQPVRLFLAAP